MQCMENKIKKTAVMVDSGADVSEEDLTTQGIYVVRMPLAINDKHYLEGVDIDDEGLINHLTAGDIVKTSQPILGDLVALWDDLLKTHDQVIYIPLSSKLSGTYQSAYLASKDYDGKVIVIDALSACAPIQVAARYAKEMSDKGIDAETIKQKIETESYMFASLIPETLTYLKNGGRIKPAVAAIGNLLKIIPILSIVGGEIDVQNKVRTVKKARQAGMEYCAKVDNHSDYEWLLVHAGKIDDLEEWKAAFEKIVNQPVTIKPIKAVIMAHTGPGTIGFARVKKIKY